MGTHGLHGFYYQGKYYVTYNQFDGYSEGLGSWVWQELYQAITSDNLEDWKNKVANLVVVDDNALQQPTEEQIEQLKPFTDLGVSRRSTRDWYCLLRKCQGSLVRVIESGHVYNYVNSAGKPAFDTFMYIVNFDLNQFEYWYTNEKHIDWSFNEITSNNFIEHLEEKMKDHPDFQCDNNDDY